MNGTSNEKKLQKIKRYLLNPGHDSSAKLYILPAQWNTCFKWTIPGSRTFFLWPLFSFFVFSLKIQLKKKYYDMSKHWRTSKEVSEVATPLSRLVTHFGSTLWNYFQLTDLNDLSHTNNDIISGVNDISDDKIDIIDVEDDDDDVIDDAKLNVENGDVFNKYKPTTTSPHSTHHHDDDDDDRLSPYPTRPSRPTKPTVRWPSFHATSSHLTSPHDNDDTSTTTVISVDVTSRHSFVHFPGAATRPTKQPPPLQGTRIKTIKFVARYITTNLGAWLKNALLIKDPFRIVTTCCENALGQGVASKGHIIIHFCNATVHCRSQHSLNEPEHLLSWASVKAFVICGASI